MTPSLGPLSLLQQLMGLKRRPVYYKREQLRRARWKRCTGQGGGRAQSFYALLRCNTLPRFPHVQQPWKLSEPPPFGFFMEASLPKHA